MKCSGPCLKHCYTNRILTGFILGAITSYILYVLIKHTKARVSKKKTKTIDKL